MPVILFITHFTRSAVWGGENSLLVLENDGQFDILQLPEDGETGTGAALRSMAKVKEFQKIITDDIDFKETVSETMSVSVASQQHPNIYSNNFTCPSSSFCNRDSGHAHWQ